MKKFKANDNKSEEHEINYRQFNKKLELLNQILSLISDINQASDEKEVKDCIPALLPSLTVAEIKNRCIPCVYWGTAIFVVVMKYSNLFFSLAFFLDRSHFAFGYELIISSEAAGFMKIICNGFTLI